MNCEVTGTVQFQGSQIGALIDWRFGIYARKTFILGISDAYQALSIKEVPAFAPNQICLLCYPFEKSQRH